MITVEDIKRNVTDWKTLFNSFGITNEYLTGKHHSCPACHGRDRFRYDNKHGNGDYFCNGCGAGDGISLIQKVNGWDFPTTKKELISYLGLEDKPLNSYQKSKYKQQSERKEYLKAKQLILIGEAMYKKKMKLTDDEIKRLKQCRKTVNEYESSHSSEFVI